MTHSCLAAVNNESNLKREQEQQNLVNQANLNDQQNNGNGDNKGKDDPSASVVPVTIHKYDDNVGLESPVEEMEGEGEKEEGGSGSDSDFGWS